jgi:K+-transporting ATPase ATPase A chain
MEGKEVRFGIANSALFATATTDASCGAVNGMHDSFTPLGGMMPLINIMLGEVVFGGVGAGFTGGRLRDSRRVHRRPDGGPHAGVPGQEDRVLRRADGHAFDSGHDLRDSGLFRLRRGQTLWNFEHFQPGTARPFADSVRLRLLGRQQRLGVRGLNANTLWYNVSTALPNCWAASSCTFRSWPSPEIWRRRKSSPESAGTFPVTGSLFAALLVSTIVIVSALTFFPALSLGPILEHLLMLSGKVF